VTSYYQFAPSASANPPFSFSPQLDGVQYNATVTWSLFGQRWYLNLVALDGTPILTTALVGSPTGIALENLEWSGGVVTATTSTPHGLKVGRVISLTISGATPDGYNGFFACQITGPQKFTYALATNPGMATVFGFENYNVNLVGGVADENGNYFSSTLVFRESAQTFETNP
jgi:hypothetical protein